MKRFSNIRLSLTNFLARSLSRKIFVRYILRNLTATNIWASFLDWRKIFYSRNNLYLWISWLEIGCLWTRYHFLLLQRLSFILMNWWIVNCISIVILYNILLLKSKFNLCFSLITTPLRLIGRIWSYLFLYLFLNMSDLCESLGLSLFRTRYSRNVDFLLNLFCDLSFLNHHWYC